MSNARQRRKIALHEQQGGLCAYCDQPITLDGSPRDWFRATFDEVVPRARGGRESLDNQVLACLICNNHKRSFTPSLLRKMADRIERVAWERGIEFPDDDGSIAPWIVRRDHFAGVGNMVAP